MTLLARRGGENMSKKTYSGVVTRVLTNAQNKQKVILKVDEIGEAIIAWGKSKPGELSKGAKK